MSNNISRDDVDAVVSFLSRKEIPILTQSKKVREFEEKWSKWLGVKHSVFVNSGSSANQISMLILKELYGGGEIIVPPLTWVSDIASVLQNGFKPVFCDINLSTLALDVKEIKKKITKNTRAIFLTHILGYNGLTQELLDLCKKKNIMLIEDVCESHGATFKGKKCGSFGLISNFSFYYAHHLTSIEGGMICTNDEKIYQYARMFRSHGMVRESTDDNLKNTYKEKYNDLNTDFIFSAPAYNMRSTEINAVMALNQLKRLDKNNKTRSANLKIFLKHLDPKTYFIEFNQNGNSNYAFTLLLKNRDFKKRDAVEKALRENNIEFRRGMSGGGNQLMQPYLRRLFGEEHKNYPNTNHVHHFGWYIGNYPDLEKSKIPRLCKILNAI
ncbi:MAG: CDP-4-keto-6-deoxy-D-glucose-3-dehydrase [Parcubacteria group bacterium Gr01-1014_91]|nr:MAG: CDP-4-keto-6-deoxy-D-glucose-3-dehydrase [Parcubacteria group bacterium Gr01-1014_91]